MTKGFVLFGVVLGILACGLEPNTGHMEQGMATDAAPNPADTGPLSPESGPLSTDAANEITIHGDWFRCETQKCDTLSYRGLRFQRDGKELALFAGPPHLTPGEAYCSSWKGENALYFEVRGNVLVTTDVGPHPFEVEAVTAHFP